jgi:drug/metabolite transporter (DMT)-like permease
MRIVFYTAFALIAFAFNSILCRMALGGGEADAASFTAIRLASGALTLAILVLTFQNKKNVAAAGNWGSAFFLFAYAVCFSFAYLGLTAATGALILFGAVQVTMIAVSIFRGEHPHAIEWVGLAVALCGLVYLVIPGLSAPPLISAVLMALAGIAWGFYTLRGRGSEDPLIDTAGNFIRSVPFAFVILIFAFSNLQISMRGILLAVLSGAAASGIGYTVWYKALRHLTSTRAAVLQLAVPVIAAIGGIALIGEALSARLLIASALILGGIGIVIAGRQR